jgi:hypothetical protein
MKNTGQAILDALKTKPSKDNPNPRKVELPQTFGAPYGKN